MHLNTFQDQVNTWGRDRIPFLFAIDFELEKPFLCRPEEALENGILFEMPEYSNSSRERKVASLQVEKTPIPLEAYKKKFDEVVEHLTYGDSFLTNLTIKTEIHSSLSLKELFLIANARYKLYFKDQLLVFSPETFVRIAEGRIYTYPMKGTIDASIPNAREIILKDPKELAEHVTIVDLMRNDLSQVAHQVSVSRFRYIEELKTNNKNLLQVSSEIVGLLPSEYRSQLGTILVKLLPAGSISGAPKSKTIRIIQQAEKEKRGYYTGVFGYFDGEKLDSAVMIRFIEQENGKMYYRSGGGITTQSDAVTEYQEAIDKIYVPVN